MFKENTSEVREDLDYVLLGSITKKLGQAQYVSLFVNPNEKAHEDGTPYFEDIRIKGDPNDYHNLKIHQDDVSTFIEKWFEYKKRTNFFYQNKTIEDFL